MHISPLHSLPLLLALLPAALCNNPHYGSGNGSGNQGPNNTNAPYPSYIYPPIEQIRYTLAQETFLIDAKDWSGLDAVYTVDAVANFTALGAGVWNGRAAIIANEQKALGAIARGTHQLATSRILINPGNFSEATVLSSYQFTHFDAIQNSTAQHVVASWTSYTDLWVDTGDYSAGGPSSWRVKNRQAVLVGSADWKIGA
ncbi:ethyl tert-butyl ether degradation protein [Rutstroemia sp. NJR-2017a WRK4]|nr:ethyl tert-butyl ether degradation protein [Rutstroemia sp. NJR-2017a WRK4]